jgi:hypothetical protein
MLTKEEILKLNRVPEGRPAWLSYADYRRLQQLLESLKPPSPGHALHHPDYVRLYDFLNADAGLDLPETEDAVHLNAFLLLRRGYHVESIMTSEYQQLVGLLEYAAPADLDDMTLHDFGSHRDLFTYLRTNLGLFVEVGRGPVWHRARKLCDAYEATNA